MKIFITGIAGFLGSHLAKHLVDLGHDVSYGDETHGGGQAISIDREKGVLTAGSDPRKDGCAIGY